MANFAERVLGPDPLGLKKDSPKKPKKTGQQLASEKRLRGSVDKEIERSESLFRLLARGKLGRQSFLSGAPRTTTEAAGVGGASRGGGAGSLLPGIRPPGVGGRRTSPSTRARQSV